MTRRAILAAFPTLGMKTEDIQIDCAGAQASVDGQWGPRVLARAIRDAGPKPLPDSDGCLWVNDDETVGAVWLGVKPHLTRSTWSTFDFDLQARRRVDGRRQRAAQQDSGLSVRFF